MYSLYKSMVVLEAIATPLSLCMQSDCFLHTLHLPKIRFMHQPVATV